MPDQPNRQPPAQPQQPADPLKDLQDKLQALEEQVTTSQQQVEAAEQEAEHSTADLDKARAQKKDAESRKTALSQVVSDIQNNQLAINTQRQAAAQDSQTALNSHDDILRELTEELSDEHRQALDHVVEEVDGEIQTLWEQVSDLRDAAPALQTAADQARRAVPEKEAALKAAQQNLKGLVKSIQDARNDVTKKAGMLTDWFQKGLLNQAYLQTSELKAAIDALGELTDPAEETALIAAVQTAWEALSTAKTTQTETAQAWTEHQAKLAKAEADFAAAKAARWQKIMDGVKELMETQQA